MARYPVLLRKSLRGWEWADARRETRSWWGHYKTEGLAKGAAKRSLPKVVGGKTRNDDFEFNLVEAPHGSR